MKKDYLIGAMEYYDARVDDARLVLTLVRTAVGLGAEAASRTAVTGMTTSPPAASTVWRCATWRPGKSSGSPPRT